MGIDFAKGAGIPLERQIFTWKDLHPKPLSKLDDDAFTRVRVLLVAAIEAESVRFQHMFARFADPEMRLWLAKVRRVEHFQEILLNSLLPSDQSPLENTIALEQAAIEITADVAQKEPDPYLAQTYRFGMLEDFDHLHRFSSLYDRVYGGDPNAILQSYTDILTARPTWEQIRVPEDDLRRPYEKDSADPLSKLHALSIVSAEHKVRNYYLDILPTFSDPVARQLYTEIMTVEEQHVTQYESLMDPKESWMEKWLLHEANEVYAYHSCATQETNPRVKAIFERCLDYELGQLEFVKEIYKKREKKDPEILLPKKLPEPIRFETHRAFVREVREKESSMRVRGTEYVSEKEQGQESVAFRKRMSESGSPSQIISEGYVWQPGSELKSQMTQFPECKDARAVGKLAKENKR